MKLLTFVLFVSLAVFSNAYDDDDCSCDAGAMDYCSVYDNDFAPLKNHYYHCPAEDTCGDVYGIDCDCVAEKCELNFDREHVDNECTSSCSHFCSHEVDCADMDDNQNMCYYFCEEWCFADRQCTTAHSFSDCESDCAPYMTGEAGEWVPEPDPISYAVCMYECNHSETEVVSVTYDEDKCSCDAGSVDYCSVYDEDFSSLKNHYYHCPAEDTCGDFFNIDCDCVAEKCELNFDKDSFDDGCASDCSHYCSHEVDCADMDDNQNMCYYFCEEWCFADRQCTTAHSFSDCESDCAPYMTGEAGEWVPEPDPISYAVCMYDCNHKDHNEDELLTFGDDSDPYCDCDPANLDFCLLDEGYFWCGNDQSCDVEEPDCDCIKSKCEAVYPSEVSKSCRVGCDDFCDHEMDCMDMDDSQSTCGFFCRTYCAAEIGKCEGARELGGDCEQSCSKYMTGEAGEWQPDPDPIEYALCMEKCWYSNFAPIQ